MQTVDMLMQEYGLNELQDGLANLFPDFNLSLEQIMHFIWNGDLSSCFSALKEGVLDQFAQEFISMKSVFISLLLIGILSALLSNIAHVFENKQIADVSFYFTYLMMIILLLRTFEQAAGTMSSLAQNTVTFMKLFLPTSFMAVGLSSGGVTAGVVYQILLCAIYLVQVAMSSFLLPAIYCYVFLNMVNGLWMEERFVLLMDAIKKGVKFILKAITTAIVGASVLQSMITPVIDSVKGVAVQKAVSVIPGLGDIASGVTQMMLGSAVLVKNSIGTCMLIVLVILCAVPLLKLLTIVVLMKGAAALMGLTADRRLAGCTDRMGEGSILLLQSAFTILILFMITIAIVSFTTNRGF